MTTPLYQELQRQIEDAEDLSFMFNNDPWAKGFMEGLSHCEVEAASAMFIINYLLHLIVERNNFMDKANGIKNVTPTVIKLEDLP